jgi:glucose/mannose-6-phosphate isomerase
MNLDDYQAFTEIDRSGMLAHIDSLPDQFEAAWQLGRRLELPAWEGIDRVLVAGMGGSAIGADLVGAFISASCPMPYLVHRNYDLPGWARGPQTLVIASSHSGNTEETLSAFERARERGCRLLVLTTGGKLASLCQQKGGALWQFEHAGQPRAAVGFSAGLILAALSRLRFIPDTGRDIEDACAAMRSQQTSLKADVPAVNNMAKRMAGQLYGRWVAVFGADILEPVARRWKTQLNEIAKAWAQFEALPEGDHNTLASTANPEPIFAQSMVIFLRAASYHPRNLLRTNLTKKAFMLQGLNTDFVDATGNSPLAHQWTTLHFGDYVAYYLAMAYRIDPTAIPSIEMFKEELAQV